MKPILLSLTLIALTNVLSAQNRYDILITEIMIDPGPPVGLPSNEWIELKNNTGTPINLSGWRMGDSGGRTDPMPDFTLDAHSYVIICTGSAIAAMSAFGNAISVPAFPSLDNSGELLYLLSPSGLTVHAIEYSAAWYQNELKKDGGWTLEMVDTGNPCAGIDNWKASTDAKGGTPGKVNAVNAVNKDLDPPSIKNAYTSNDTIIRLVFNESVDSLNAASPGSYSFTGMTSISSVTPVPPLFREVEIKMNAALSAGTIYTVMVTNITDCSGNVIASNNQAKFGLPETAATGDGIINEILFNPRPGGYDYVEFLNAGDKILDVSLLYIANRNNSGVISSITRVSDKPAYLFPGDYMVVTTDADNLALNYLVREPGAVYVVSSFPSYPDDAGTVLLLNQQGEILDEVKYDDDWHFKLIDNDEGVALERLDPAKESQHAANWHSAASTAGYGTPGYKNSQSVSLQSNAAAIEVIPKVFSPDNDGFDDIASVQYKVGDPGYVANITIFDAAGRPVRNLVRNGTLSTSGYWNWDGLDNKGLKLPVGTYILYTELFNLQGKKQLFKNAVVLARRF